MRDLDYSELEAEIRTKGGFVLTQLDLGEVDTDSFEDFLEVMRKAVAVRSLPATPDAFHAVAIDMWGRVIDAALRLDFFKEAVEEVLAEEMRAEGKTN